MLTHPWLRKQLIRTIENLADSEYPRRAWVNHQFPPGIVHDCFDYTVHFLFDDTGLFDGTEETIGSILENEAEVDAIKPVTKAIDDLLKVLGTELTDEEYISSPMWEFVIDAASNALIIFKKNTD